MVRIIVANALDNVGNIIDDVKQGELMEYAANGKLYTITAASDIPYGFKAALKNISRGEDIVKYGYVIGKASADIVAGECVHVHNIEGGRGRGDKEGK